LFAQLNLLDFGVTILILILSIALHELAHAWSAMRLGDRTAYYQGRVTLNPAVHLDPMGTMMMIFTALTGVGIGWGKPVPVNPFNLKYGPRIGMALTAAAGPLCNILQAIVWGIPLRLAYHGTLDLPELALNALWIGLSVNIGLAIFNLIPIFPLDGFNILLGGLEAIRTRWANDALRFLTQPSFMQMAPMLLLGLIFLDQMTPGRGILGTILMVPAEQLTRLILGV
jgi:Zn-dependent protease